MTEAVIAGAGIAGTVTAIALHKAGIEAAVYEAYPVRADEIGAFVTLSTNAFDGLAAIDCAEVIRAGSFDAATVELFNSAGVQVGSIPARSRTISRATLYQLLQREAERRGIRIEHGKRLVAARERDGVTVTFADGTETAGDLLIGADGVRSATRRMIDPAAPAPRYTGLQVICGYADDPGHIAPDGYRMTPHPGGFFGYTTAPDGSTWWFARVPSSEMDISGLTAADWKTRVAAAFDPATDAGELIRDTDRIIGYSSYDLPSLPVWHTDRMIVIGDAAHAASPASAQGASMAIEDGVTLGQCLRDLPAPAAFRAYEQRRRARVERVVFNGAQASPATREEPANPPPRREPGSMEWLYGHHIDWDEKITE